MEEDDVDDESGTHKYTVRKNMDILFVVAETRHQSAASMTTCESVRVTSGNGVHFIPPPRDSEI